MGFPSYLYKREDESFDDYHVRLFDHQDDYGIDRYTIAELLNEEADTDYDESKWRKDYASYRRWRDYIVQRNLDEERLQMYEEKRLEEKKERYRNQDQRREYRKLIRNMARFEKLQEDVVDAVLDLRHLKELPSFDWEKISVDNEKHGLALFSDWHYGTEVDTNTNQFNKEIFEQRLRKLIDKVIEHGVKNKISTLHIAQLGDLISGLIWVSTRVQANEDLIEQIKQASERVAEVVNELAQVFPNIVYYNVIGNHGRSHASRSDVGISENFEYLVPWYLEARLSHLDNVEIVTDKDGYIVADILDKKYVFVHGNYDNADRSVSRLPQLLGFVPDYIIGGHVHHKSMREHGKTITITNGSLIGLDDHSTQGRFAGRPSQTFLLLDKEEGLEGEFRINLGD